MAERLPEMPSPPTSLGSWLAPFDVASPAMAAGPYNHHMAKKAAKAAVKITTNADNGKDATESGPGSKYPRHPVGKALRIPKAILDQNAGKACTDADAAKYAGIGYHGPTRQEISSSIKYGLLSRPTGGQVVPTDLARRILRPQGQSDELDGKRQAVMNAPVLGDVYKHYRGENLPEPAFLANTLVDTFKVPKDNVPDFLGVFNESLGDAQLLEERDGKRRVVDATHTAASGPDNSKVLQRLSKEAAVASGDTCFVVMPFATPIGTYYSLVFEPAIRKAGLTPARADSEIFGIGKIIDQIWKGINDAKVLVAELTTRNPNVFYELGLAHALNKPVVLVAGKEEDVPFDLRHIRVIYYDTADPFWGQKLLDKVAENILSALKTPEEAMFKSALTK